MSHKIDAAQHRRPVDTELIEEKIKELRDDQLSPEQARRLNEIISTIEEALGENRGDVD